MSEIAQFVDLNITRDTATLKRQGFGVAVVVAYHTENTDAYRRYDDLTGLTADGHALGSAVYRKVAAAFSQDPAPDEVIVARLGAAPAYTWTFTITDATEGNHIKLLVVSPDGTETLIDYTIPAAATTTTVATAVELLIEAVTGIASASSGPTITVTPAVAGERFWLANPQGGDILETTADANYDDALTVLRLLDDSWYFIHIDSDSKANVDLVAAYALANQKLFFTTTNASNELSGVGTLGFDLKAAANERVAVIWTPETHDSADAAWAAIGAANDPGSITFAHQTLAGVTAKSLTPTQRNNLEADNINHYQPMPAGNRVAQGVVASGEFLDIIHGTDALKSRIYEDVYLALVSSKKKVPYTEKGVEKLLNALMGAMLAFVGTDDSPGLLKEGTLKVWASKKTKDVAAVDKRARDYPYLKFYAEYEGAIHKVGINGTLTV